MSQFHLSCQASAVGDTPMAVSAAQALSDANSSQQVTARLENYLGLTAAEEEKCNQAFKAFDRDGNEELDVDELRIVLKMMGINVSEAKIQRMMTEASPENPTTISKDQFKRVIGK